MYEHVGNGILLDRSDDAISVGVGIFIVLNFAIKAEALRDFLDNSVVSYQTAEPSAELQTAQVASNARAYTMLVSCSAKEEASTDK
jgi:hypothetical protein